MLFRSDRRWCHLVSDTSYDELHVFADLLDLPRRAFHGDHYDVPAEHRPRAVELGAREVTSRDVVAILRQSGLRVRPDDRRRWVQPTTITLAATDANATNAGTA